MNNYEQLQNIVNQGNKMGLSNTIMRDYGIPLDYTSVQPSYTEAIKYAATNSLAYVGQLITVGSLVYVLTEQSQGQHMIDGITYNIYIKELTSSNMGDNYVTKSEWSESKDAFDALQVRVSSVEETVGLLDGGLDVDKLVQSKDSVLFLNCGNI
jgi:hypothetical protein